MIEGMPEVRFTVEASGDGVDPLDRYWLMRWEMEVDGERYGDEYRGTTISDPATLETVRKAQQEQAERVYAELTRWDIDHPLTLRE